MGIWSFAGAPPEFDEIIGIWKIFAEFWQSILLNSHEKFNLNSKIHENSIEYFCQILRISLNSFIFREFHQILVVHRKTTKSPYRKNWICLQIKSWHRGCKCNHRIMLFQQILLLRNYFRICWNLLFLS